LLERLPEVFPKLSVRLMQPNDLLETLGEVPLKDQQAYAAQLQVLEDILERFECRIDIKTFDPGDLPALYTASSSAQFRREVDQTQEIASDLWSGLLDKVKPAGNDDQDRACLCLNWRNPVIQRLLKVKPGPVVNRAVELLYVQALLQGHFPLGPRERRVLGEGVTGLINLALQVQA
jgi:molecular chaperone HtpG